MDRKGLWLLPQPLSGFPILTAAAAEDQQQCDDNQPDPVVVKQIAKTVIHKNSSVESIEGDCPTFLSYEGV